MKQIFITLSILIFASYMTGTASAQYIPDDSPNSETPYRPPFFQSGSPAENHYWCNWTALGGCRLLENSCNVSDGYRLPPDACTGTTQATCLDPADFDTDWPGIACQVQSINEPDPGYFFCGWYEDREPNCQLTLEACDETEGYSAEPNVCGSINSYSTCDITQYPPDFKGFACTPPVDSTRDSNFLTCGGSGSCEPCEAGDRYCFEFEDINYCNAACDAGRFLWGCNTDLYRCRPTPGGVNSRAGCNEECTPPPPQVTCDDDASIDTALGCIPFTNVNIFTVNAIQRGAYIAGGIALLIISLSAVLYMTSAGNPQALGQAKELVIAAITGLLLIALGILVYRVIAINILGLF